MSRFTTTIIIEPDHPSLPGHFPGAPMVPGAVLLTLVQAAFAELLPERPWKNIIKTKFENPAPINERIDLTIEANTTGARFVCRYKDLPVVSGRVSFL